VTGRLCGPQTPLDGRAALVTGASGGIGRAIAVALAAGGADVCVVGRDERRPADTVNVVAAHGTATVSLVADLTEKGRIDQLVDLVDRRLGGLDVLVHSACIYSRGLLAVSGIRELDAQYQANIRLPYRLTQVALPLLVSRRGDVVSINSTQDSRPAVGWGSTPRLSMPCGGWPTA
jgi:NAD(P)-dependent dehydrogenase (short-subunit alcohol dehydrogenase family)